jgi:hypothetical protein
MYRILAGLLLCTSTAFAQQPHDMMQMGGDAPGPVTPLGVSMDRMGSGTTWIPDAVRLPSAQRMTHGWHLVGHGFAFGQYDRQGGARGASQVGSLSWMMLMATHTLAGGRVQMRTMLSLDAAGVTARGYPLLLQTGESYQGQPLHDRQHPHDFFMELGVMYERALTHTVGVELFAAPSGEPALGPVAFMHRPSAMDDPVAPISHHWQDATHISFGVVTAGLFGHRWKLEGSAFNGREPDEQRFGFDRMRLDSYAGRLTINPSDHVSVTLGHGWLASPEASSPGESIHRTTSSLLYGKQLGADGQLAATLVWGLNAFSTGARTQAVLAEGEAVLDAHNTVFARVERARKSADDLAVPVASPASVFYDVSNVSLGYIREIVRTSGATLGLGLRGTVNLLPASLAPFYGSRTPAGVLVFVRLRPAHRAAADAMPGMEM